MKKISSPLEADGPVPEATYFCQIDTHRAVKDYQRNGRCVRLLAVSEHGFTEEALESGVTTFTIDIDYWWFCANVLSVPSWRSLSRRRCSEIDARDDDAELMSSWFRLVLDLQAKDVGYFYKTFSEDPPKRFGVRSFERLLKGLSVPAAAALASGKPSMSLTTTSIRTRIPGSQQQTGKLQAGRGFHFDAFHVGQGMCSLVHDGDQGVLLDVGAGKPVTRKAYLAQTLHNDLARATQSLRSLCAIISHADSDHWRVLAWDSVLRRRVTDIFVPVGARSLAFRDLAVMSKIKGMANSTWSLDATSKLEVLRSQQGGPVNDSNGDGLVVVFHKATDQILAPGDYVYDRYPFDQNRAISRLGSRVYSGVVVPHHGDVASSRAVVSAGNGAKAFFSAGTHQGYGHPTPQSVSAHKSANYAIVSQPNLGDIVAVRLL